MANQSKREILIKTAQKLFSKHGFHAVGIDSILEESGVAKRTLYNQFRSKDELILAVLRYYDERFRNNFMRSVEETAETPQGRLLGIFDVAEKWFGEEDYFGCIFVGATGEFPEEGTAIRNICREFKRLMMEYIYDLAVQGILQHPRELAEQLLLLLEGAITMAQINQSPASARQAKKAAQVLIQNSVA